MGYRYAVLGAGRQGTACAYDMIKFGEADEVLLADQSLEVAQAAAPLPVSTPFSVPCPTILTWRSPKRL
jgi:saccharopine dehydrogenase-like NADP-dependent oxidoreductase